MNLHEKVVKRLFCGDEGQGDSLLGPNKKPGNDAGLDR
jgi:hypothetical protein